MAFGDKILRCTKKATRFDCKMFGRKSKTEFFKNISSVSITTGKVIDLDVLGIELDIPTSHICVKRDNILDCGRKTHMRMKARRKKK